MKLKELLDEAIIDMSTLYDSDEPLTKQDMDLMITKLFKGKDTKENGDNFQILMGILDLKHIGYKAIKGYVGKLKDYLHDTVIEDIKRS